MLNEVLIAKTRPIANSKSVVVFNKYRISVLTDSLFRIEENDYGKYCDEATQIVWYRDFDKVNFTTIVENGCLLIKTNKVSICINKDFEKSFVIINGKKTPINNKENLLGTYRTLDRYNGDVYDGDGSKMKLENGVVSKNGVAVLDDSKSLILLPDGSIEPRDIEEMDIYVFAFGKEYREAVKALYKITGKVPMIPRFALGNWWSRYHAYSDKEYLHLLDDLENENVPITVGVIDMDWHWSTDLDKRMKISESGKDDEYHGYKSGWTGFSWNTELFPDWKRTVKKIHDKKIKVSLNLHPAAGVRFFEDMYKEVATAVGVDPSTEKRVEFDMTNEKFVNAYFDYVLDPYEKDGIDFWWIDWQQGQKSAIPGLDPLWLLNHYQYLNAKDKESPVILSRYSGLGSHRYPIGFSGDTHITWDTLEYQPYFTLTATNAGYPWWSHDIGGHMKGYKDDELFVRLLQLGVFSPINRLHCSCESVLTKEPIVYMNGTGYIASNYLRFRHRLIPYLYSANWETSNLGLAIVEPLYYEYPDVKASYSLKNEYLFGRQLLVSAITTPGEGKDKLSKTKMYIPSGHWTDIFTGDEYEGDRVIDVYRWLDTIPVLAKSGSFIPLDHSTSDNNCDLPKHLDVMVFNGDGEYNLHEDENDCELCTCFKSHLVGDNQKVVFKTNGVPSNGRTITFMFKNIPTGIASVTANGKKCECDFDDNGYVSITLKNIKQDVEYIINVKFDATYSSKNKQLIYTLTRLVGDNTKKHELLCKLLVADDLEAKELIEMADFLSPYGRKRLLEVVKG
ncbi:MAG: alpha-xylosidase [Clostridia bacterium]|nr:alpha-xylosidase [Clostridia bacterium]